MSVRSSLHEGIKTFDKLRHLQTLLFFGSTSLLLVRERISFYPIHVSNPVGQYRTDWIFKKTAGGAFHSPPVVGPDGTIYAGSYDGNMYAINPSGVLQWNFSTRGDGIYYSAAVVDSNGNVYFIASNKYLYALSATGTFIWEFILPWISNLDGLVYSTPALGSDGTVYVVVRGENLQDNVHAISSTGLTNGGAEMGSPTWTSPALGADGSIYVGSCNFLMALGSGMTEKWIYYTDSCVGSPVVGPDGNIYVGSGGGKVYAFLPSSELLWTLEIGGAISAPPAVGSDGSIYIKSSDAKVYALSSDGNLKWTYTTDSSWGRTVLGSDGRIYVESLSSLYVLSPDGELVWQFDQGGHVAVPGNTAYLTSSDDGNLYALSEITVEHDTANGSK